ncbi:hypothetical protein N6H14_01775 [Paenibacillus sp. CC-CFT747]|nr:hypothetical protein N6H14_01775 [Paenibacillus sp. CC-CFT747]
MRADPFIIDADVHNTLGRLKDLVPYLPKVWHQQWLESGIGVHGQYYSPVGVLRQDAVPDSGGPAGSDPRFVLKHYMEPNAIDFAVLTGRRTGPLASRRPGLRHGRSRRLQRLADGYVAEGKSEIQGLRPN